MSEFITGLSDEKKKTAEDARKAASEVVQDAIDKGFYGFPVKFRYTCSEPVDSYQCCCIPTKEFLEELVAMLSKISFKEDNDPEHCDTYAYVIPNNGDNIVYLCKEFWKAKNTMSGDCKDSQPGTLIHEASHLLGTEDVTYDNIKVEMFENYGTLLGKSIFFGGMRHQEELLHMSANSLEYEFETIINHEGEYSDGKYQCCGEPKENSVCRGRSTGHYHLHERFPYCNPDWMKIKYVRKKGMACVRIPVSKP